MRAFLLDPENRLPQSVLLEMMFQLCTVNDVRMYNVDINMYRRLFTEGARVVLMCLFSSMQFK